MLDWVLLRGAEEWAVTHLAEPQVAVVEDPDRPLSKAEQKARIRAGMERDRRARQQQAARR